jgi:hypothetical protein
VDLFIPEMIDLDLPSGKIKDEGEPPEVDVEGKNYVPQVEFENFLEDI